MHDEPNSFQWFRYSDIEIGKGLQGLELRAPTKTETIELSAEDIGAKPETLEVPVDGENYDLDDPDPREWKRGQMRRSAVVELTLLSEFLGSDIAARASAYRNFAMRWGFLNNPGGPERVAYWDENLAGLRAFMAASLAAPAKGRGRTAPLRDFLALDLQQTPLALRVYLSDLKAGLAEADVARIRDLSGWLMDGLFAEITLAGHIRAGLRRETVATLLGYAWLRIRDSWRREVRAEECTTCAQLFWPNPRSSRPAKRERTRRGVFCSTRCKSQDQRHRARKAPSRKTPPKLQ